MTVTYNTVRTETTPLSHERPRSPTSMASPAPPPKPGPEVATRTPPGLTNDQAQAWRMVQRLRDRVLQDAATPRVQARIDGLVDKIMDQTRPEGVDPDAVKML